MGDEFREAMEAVLRAIPRGRVATCGAIARALGDVRAARAVAVWLADHRDLEGADRVVRADGQALFPVRTSPRIEPGVISRRPRSPARFVDDLPERGLLRSYREDQERMARLVRERDEFIEDPELGAVDVAYSGELAFAAAVRCANNGSEVKETAVASLSVAFPYIPGYLAFREVPAAEVAVQRLRRAPDILMVDGHGRLHPSLFGLACHLGVRLDLPTIGVAKHPLVGRPSWTKGAEGAPLPIAFAGSTRGYAWTPPQAGRPIYVSVGHRISLRTAVAIVQRATRGRYPQPLVEADRLSKEMKRRSKEGKKVGQ